MKKKENNNINYYIRICRVVRFHVKLIEFKLERKLPLTRYEEDLLSFFVEYEYLIIALEGADYNE